jgi:arabinofuranan 3-O-arabinosyltransferase
MGGVNAAVVIATLPVGAIWLLTRKPGPRRRALIAWWLVALGLACFWWLVLLVLAGKYSYNYLPYTETAAVTTGTTSAFEALRGASYWLNYYTLGGPLLPGAWTIVSSPVVIVGTSILTALGLAGLCRRIPERLFLVASLSVGVVVIAAGYAGTVGGPFAHTVQHLLGSSLAPLRNVSKFSPDVALPLALGLAWTVSGSFWREYGSRIRRWKPTTAVSQVSVRVVAVVAVAIAATPFWHLQLYKAGGFTRIPQYWSQAATWLDAHQGKESSLLVPGASFGDYTWGRPSDEPLQALLDKSVDWRNLIPLASSGYIEMLDAVEQTLDSGIASNGLAKYLSQEGIEYVVERNDLNLKLTGAPPPAQVHQVLSETPGLSEVASFGERLPANQVAFGILPVYDSPSDLDLPAVQIFRVDPPSSVAQTYPVADPLVISGDPGSLLTLDDAGLLPGRAPALAGDPLARGAASASQATWVITDGNQRRREGFGSIRNNLSYLLNADQGLGSSATPQHFTVVPGTEHQTVEAAIGAASVSASSFGSSYLIDDPAEGPASAFDNDPLTAWVADAIDHSIGQWVSITLRHPVFMSSITVTPLVDSPYRPSVSWVSISTDRGTVRRYLPASKIPVTLSISSGSSIHLSISIDAVRLPLKSPHGGILLGAGITNVTIPGVSFEQDMKVPNDEAAEFSGSDRNPPVIVFSRPETNPNLTLGFSETDDPFMARTFAIPRAMTVGITGEVEPVPGPALLNLIDQRAPPPSSTPQLTATSWLGDLPRFQPENLVENSGLPWIAGLGDKKPTVTVTWSQPREVGSLWLKLSSQASRPTEIQITGQSGQTLRRPVPAVGGFIHFTPMMTNSLKIQFVGSVSRVTLSPAFDVEMTVPVGLAALSVPALGVSPAPEPNLKATFTLACGLGPMLQVDHTSVPTLVSGSIGELLDLQPLRLVACTPKGGLPLTAGIHIFQTTPTALATKFEVTSLVARDASPDVVSVLSPRSAKVEHWTAESRTVAVGAGPATYLVVPENYNVGWVAELGGKTLTPVRINGWEQGFIVPAGPPGTVRLTIAANSVYQGLLAVGAVLLFGLLLLALLPARRSRRTAVGPRPLPIDAVLMAFAAIVLVLIAGPFALVAVPLFFAARRWGEGRMAVAAFFAFAVAGAAAAWSPGALPATHSGAFGAPAQVASAVALAVVLSALVAEARGWRSGSGVFEPEEAAEGSQFPRHRAHSRRRWLISRRVPDVGHPPPD